MDEDNSAPRIIPQEPQSIAETGTTLGFLADLTLKTIYFRGELSAQQIADDLKLPFLNVIDKVLDFLKREEMVAISGSKGFGERGFQYVIAPKGVERVREALLRSQYVGPAPVTLEAYTAVVREQTIAHVTVDPPRVEQAFSHLVLPRATLNRLGPAINSGRSMFLYGPPGNGKTTIAEAIAQLLRGDIYIPYAVEADGHIIKVYDPLNHQAVVEPPTPFNPLGPLGQKRPDGRWVRCRRPVVMVGGELTLESLDLVYDEIAKYYEAPFQMKANNGMFLIDDFGRQQVRPRDLLNRWIVPLEKRVDFLTLHTGKKIEIPFDELIVFSTNIAPKELVDEAFLRRIRHKIEIGNPTVAQYHTIMERVCSARGIAFNEEAFNYLIQEHYVKAERDMKSVHPRDLIDQLIDSAKYQGIRPAMTKELLDEACQSYFVKF